MIVSRILFYTTYDTDLDFGKIVAQHSLAENIHYVGGRYDEEKENSPADYSTANSSTCEAISQKWKENLFTNRRISPERRSQTSLQHWEATP
jgi:hypothetical protein